MSWVGFEPMIPAFRRVKSVHALNCVAMVLKHIVLVQQFYAQIETMLTILVNKLTVSIKRLK
jgi:hypothetical protein